MSEGTTRTRRTGGFTVMQNVTVYDKELSYAALGILAVLLARPDDAPKGYRSLMRPGVGQKSILTAFGELRKAGYRYQFYRHETDERGRPHIYTDTYIYDVPVSLEEAKRDHFEATGKVAIDVKGKSARAKAEAAAAAERAAAEEVDVEADEAEAAAAVAKLQAEWAAQDAAKKPDETEPESIHGASLRDAHGEAFHGASLGDAHKRVAQDLGGLPAGVTAHTSPTPEILKKDEQAELPAQSTDNSSDDATQPQPDEGTEQGRARVREMLAERRAKRRVSNKGSRFAPAYDEERAGDLVHV